MSNIYFAEGIEPKLILKPTNKSDLKNSIAYLYLSFKQNDNTFLNENLNNIDTSLITDFSNIFKETFENTAETLRRKSLNKPIFQYEKIENDFFSGIGQWDTKNANNLSCMFANLINFNQPIDFNLNNAKDISFMFYKCENFNQPINFNFNIDYKLNAKYFLSCAKSFNQNVIFSNKLYSCYIDIESIFFSNSKFNQNFTLKGFQAIDNAMNAFAKCSNLTQLTLQSPFIGNAENLFNGCTSLNDLEIEIQTPLLKAFLENTVSFQNDITIKNSSIYPLDLRGAFKNSKISSLTIICESNITNPKICNRTFKGVVDSFNINYKTPKKMQMLIQKALEKAKIENKLDSMSKKIDNLLQIIETKDKQIKVLENEIKRLGSKKYKSVR